MMEAQPVFCFDVDQPAKVVVVGDSVVIVDRECEHLRTRYPDCAEVSAAPNSDEASIANALMMGYGDDLWAMSRDHELLHTWLAFRETGGVSPTLWAVAHGFGPGTAPLDEQRVEEGRILKLQATVRGGSWKGEVTEEAEIVEAARAFLWSLGYFGEAMQGG